jgi:hypothetical protein
MKKIFKQLFCKHEWETSSNSLSIEDFYTHKNTVVSEIHKVCKKCGKQIVMAIALFLVCTLSFTSCTEQIRTRTFGGTMVIDVPNGYKVTSATWKETDLFYFMEPMEEGYTPTDKMFIESSSYGMLESKIIFKEKR